MTGRCGKIRTLDKDAEAARRVPVVRQALRGGRRMGDGISPGVQASERASWMKKVAGGWAKPTAWLVMSPSRTGAQQEARLSPDPWSQGSGRESSLWPMDALSDPCFNP